MRDLVEIVDKIVMVDPVDAGLDEAEEIDEEDREGLAKGIDVAYFLAGDMEFQDHDGDDDGDNAVGECLQPGGAEAIWFFLGHPLKIHRQWGTLHRFPDDLTDTNPCAR